jgi:hypothetical protein
LGKNDLNSPKSKNKSKNNGILKSPRGGLVSEPSLWHPKNSAEGWNIRQRKVGVLSWNALESVFVLANPSTSANYIKTLNYRK